MRKVPSAILLLKTKLVFALTTFFAFASANAAMTAVTNSPSAWRIENYPGTVVVWFTSSACTNGQISFGPSSTQADMNRFWATVMIAKATGKKMFIYYENANAPASCPIISFGLDAE